MDFMGVSEKGGIEKKIRSRLTPTETLRQSLSSMYSNMFIETLFFSKSSFSSGGNKKFKKPIIYAFYPLY
jgi:hypothetical protein